jgi:hypothetical protein
MSSSFFLSRNEDLQYPCSCKALFNISHDAVEYLANLNGAEKTHYRFFIMLKRCFPSSSMLPKQVRLSVKKSWKNDRILNGQSMGLANSGCFSR